MTNIEEAVKWLSYTYLYVRMRCNPLAYGINYNAVEVSHKLFSIIVLEANSIKHYVSLKCIFFSLSLSQKITVSLSL